MSDPHIRAAFYLSPTLDAFWRWSEDGEVLTWTDDTTIAFAIEVEAVLRRLSPRGLPPFGAVALLLAACRDAWPNSSGREAIAAYPHRFAGIGSADGSSGALLGAQSIYHKVSREIDRLLEGLDAVNHLQRDLRDGPAAKALLAEMVFETSKNRGNPEDSADILRAIEHGVNPETLRPQLCHDQSLAQFARQMEGLPEGLARVDEEALLLRRETGLDQGVVAPEEDLSVPQRVRQLLAGLRDDAELSGLARLAHDLMAAVSIPRTLRSRDELPIGGVSDLSNRGPLDRLLVSELAHDDLTLAVRVAVNEALYLRRESPPKQPPNRRAILLDAGIRMWGIPRLFATAAALALAATNDPKSELQVFRAARDRVDPVDLTTRRGLEAHLSALDASPHPGPALGAFLDQARFPRDTGVPPVPTALNAQISGPDRHRQFDRDLHGRDGRVTMSRVTKSPNPADETDTDAILITHADALGDAEFLKVLHALSIPSIYIATVDRAGEFRLLLFTKAGRKPIREAKLALDRILAPAPQEKRGQAAAPLVAAGVNPELPAIFFADPFPFLLPHVADPKLAATSEKHGLVAATQDGRLLHWKDGEHGGRQLTSKLPTGQVRLILIEDPADRALVFIARHHQPTLQRITADLKTGGCTFGQINMREPGPKGMFVWAGILYVVHADRVDGFDLATDQQIGTVQLSAGVTWDRERFFKFQDHFLAIGYDASMKLKLDIVPHARDAIALFDRDGSAGPWAITKTGDITDWHGKVQDSFNKICGPQWSLAGISRDGTQIAIRSHDGQRVHSICTTGVLGRLPRVLNDPAEARLGRKFSNARSWISARNKFSGIFVDAQSRLSLVSTKDDVFSFALDAKGELVMMQIGRASALPADLRKFDKQVRWPGGRTWLRQASWDDGSKAWLDARGLVHLRSSDPEIPEISITLSNTRPAVWTSRGLLYGPAYFIEDNAETTAGSGASVDNLLKRFVARLR